MTRNFSTCSLSAMHHRLQQVYRDEEEEVRCLTLASEDMAVPRDSEEYKQLYDNIGVVGSGTFGSVYCAVERETEEYVAAKYMILQIEKVCAILNAFHCIKIFKKLATLIIIKTQCHNPQHFAIENTHKNSFSGYC